MVLLNILATKPLAVAVLVTLYWPPTGPAMAKVLTLVAVVAAGAVALITEIVGPP